MASVLSDLIINGNFSAARRYTEREETQMVSLTSVVGKVTVDDMYMVAQVVKVKRGGFKRIQKTQDGRKLAKVEVAYDRLLMLRELYKGSLFYVKTATNKESSNLLRIKGISWLGAMVVVYEPSHEVSNNMYGLPMIETEAPLLPITTQMTSPLLPYVPEGAAEGNFFPIYGVIDDLQLSHVDIAYACPVAACDGSHDETVNCFGMEGSGPAGLVIKMNVASQTLRIRQTKLQSRAVAQLFLDTAYFGARATAPKVDLGQLRRHVRQTVQAYRTRGISWVASGWYKTAISGGSEVAKANKFHLTYLQPQQILADLPPLAPPAQVIPVAPLGDRVDDRMAAPVQAGPVNQAAAPVQAGPVNQAGGNGNPANRNPAVENVNGEGAN